MGLPMLRVILLLLVFAWLGCQRGSPLGAALQSGDLASVQEAIRTEFAEVPTISTGRLAARYDQPDRGLPVILDVRTADEFAVSHLPSARRVEPDGDAAAQLGDLPCTTEIVVYCSVGWRSGLFARRLQHAGYLNVANLDGSIFRWATEGRPLITPAGQTTRVVHPYDLQWGRLLAPELRSAR